MNGKPGLSSRSNLGCHHRTIILSPEKEMTQDGMMTGDTTEFCPRTKRRWLAVWTWAGRGISLFLCFMCQGWALDRLKPHSAERYLLVDLPTARCPTPQMPLYSVTTRAAEGRAGSHGGNALLGNLRQTESWGLWLHTSSLPCPSWTISRTPWVSPLGFQIQTGSLKNLNV